MTSTEIPVGATLITSSFSTYPFMHRYQYTDLSFHFHPPLNASDFLFIDNTNVLFHLHLHIPSPTKISHHFPRLFVLGKSIYKVSYCKWKFVCLRERESKKFHWKLGGCLSVSLPLKKKKKKYCVWLERASSQETCKYRIFFFSIMQQSNGRTLILLYVPNDIQMIMK